MGSDVVSWDTGQHAWGADPYADALRSGRGPSERIWLPFAVWLPAACALLPAARRRAWLTAQAMLALLLNHLLYTGW
ncbi:hypothetical protein ACWCO0_03755 [Streptomyces tubercidicus]